MPKIGVMSVATLCVVLSFAAGVRRSGKGSRQMNTKQISVQRFSVTSSKSFAKVIAAFEAGIGHPDMNAFHKDIGAAKTYAQLETVVNKATGAAGLMEFYRFDLGEVVAKERGPQTPKSLRFLVGNPLIMKQMTERSPDAGSYAPVTILIDERPDGVHLSYDTMASFLAPYENPEALKVAQDLDAKVEALLTKAAN